MVKDASARDGNGVKLSDGSIRVHHSLLHDNRDRVHSSMDSLTNANCKPTALKYKEANYSVIHISFIVPI